MLKQFATLLKRETRAVIHFSDTFSERPVDFDAKLTTTFRNVGNLQDMMIPVGEHPEWCVYGAVLLNDLAGEEYRLIARAKELGAANHPDIKRKIRQSEQALVCILNNAPRNKETTANGKNGRDFYLAISTSGVEFYTTPLERLSGLELRNEILALYRIPNEAQPFFRGEREQFRSSIITTSRLLPDHMETVFEYRTVAELLEAKESGSHPDAIPLPDYEAKVGFVDKFGNVRLDVRDIHTFLAKLQDTVNSGVVNLRFGTSQKTLTVHVVSSLRDVPEGEVGIYHNVADALPDVGMPGYVELVRKMHNPNNPEEGIRVLLNAVSASWEQDEIAISA